MSQLPLLPLSKGSERLESPPGETLSEFFSRFMKRKILKTGWRSGKAQQQDLRRPDKTPLERPFISLFDAMEEAGFIGNWREGIEVLERLAASDPTVGISRKGTVIRYWQQRVVPKRDIGEF